MHDTCRIIGNLREKGVEGGMENGCSEWWMREGGSRRDKRRGEKEGRKVQQEKYEIIMCLKSQ